MKTKTKIILGMIAALVLVPFLMSCAFRAVDPSAGYCTCQDDPEAAAEIETALKADAAELRK